MWFVARDRYNDKDSFFLKRWVHTHMNKKKLKSINKHNLQPNSWLTFLLVFFLSSDLPYSSTSRCNHRNFILNILCTLFTWVNKVYLVFINERHRRFCKENLVFVFKFFFLQRLFCTSVFRLLHFKIVWVHKQLNCPVNFS